MTRKIVTLHTHWRLTFESGSFFTSDPELHDIWIDAWTGDRPVSIDEAVAQAVLKQPALRLSILAGAARVRV